MTHPDSTVTLRRPPAPTEHLATVTRLSPPGAAPVPVPVATVQGALALDLDQLPRRPTTPELRLLPAATADPAEDPTHREVRLWAAQFSQAVVEVVGGDRPVSQLLRWTSLRVYQEIDRRVRILGRTTAAPTRRRTVSPQVRSVHVCHPREDVAEVSVHVRHGHRSRAVAARLERREDRWTCVALQLG